MCHIAIRACSSAMLFCTGVPLSSSHQRTGSSSSAALVALTRLLRRWASSTIAAWRSGCGGGGGEGRGGVGRGGEGWGGVGRGGEGWGVHSGIRFRFLVALSCQRPPAIPQPREGSGDHAAVHLPAPPTHIHSHTAAQPHTAPQQHSHTPTGCTHLVMQLFEFALIFENSLITDQQHMKPWPQHLCVYVVHRIGV